MDWPTFATIVVLTVTSAYLYLVTLRVAERVSVHKATTEAEKIAKVQLAAAKARWHRSSKSQKNGSDDEDDEEIPGWLRGMAKGAGIDVEKLFDDDGAEWAKVKKLVDRRVAKKGEEGDLDDVPEWPV